MALVLVMLEATCRDSCVTKHCPLTRDLYFPPQRLWRDEIPPYVEIGFRSDKSHSDNGTVRYVRLYRNCANPTLCVVWWIMQMLAQRGHSDGALFQDEDGENWSEEQLRKWSKELFGSVGLHHCSTHSWRVSGANWMARLGADPVQIAAVMRCEVSNVARYYDGGRAQRKNALDLHGGLDPCWLVLPWMGGGGSTSGQDARMAAGLGFHTMNARRHVAIAAAAARAAM